MNLYRNLSILILFLHIYYFTQAQTLMGNITNAATKQPISGAIITIKQTGQSIVSDSNGHYQMLLQTTGTITVLYAYQGNEFDNRTIRVFNKNEIIREDIIWQKSFNDLSQVLVVGARSIPRSAVSTALPIDKLSNKTLEESGQLLLDKALLYRVPSFSSTHVAVYGSGSFIDPFELRNLGSSRTLVLLNGKRKNAGSLIYTFNTIGVGETGVDLNFIPIAAIKSVEILRDGASAQYGSDAIAGAINIILKDNINYSSLNVNNGVTWKGDGLSYGANFNTGSTFKKGGFINATVAFQQLGATNRAGKVNPYGDIATLTKGTSADTQAVFSFLNKYPDGKNINGNTNTTIFNFAINTSIPTSEKSAFYFQGTYMYKRVYNTVNYRAPYWVPDPYNIITPAGQPYIGFLPVGITNINNYTATIGYKTLLRGWQIDMSATAGGDKLLLNVQNAINSSLGPNSPISFNDGGSAFNQIVGNIDLSKSILPNLSIAFGTEIRTENYNIIPGDSFSYVGTGAQALPGVRQDDAVRGNRFNIGAYGDVSWNIAKKLLLNATLREEQYSDFGNAFVWKLNANYNIVKQLYIRGSISSGFKAPSLQQIYYQSIQGTFVNGGVSLQGIANNTSRAARAFGIPSLKAESSLNFGGGIGYAPNYHVTITVDYYNILINNRIVLSSAISSNDPNSVIGKLLNQLNVTGLSFFTNAINTRTQGVDLVVNYKNVYISPQAYMNFNLAANYNQTNLIGKIQTPPVIAASGNVIFNRSQAALVLTSRPMVKFVLGAEFIFKKLSLNIYNTFFGPATFVNVNIPTYNVSADTIGKGNTLPRLVFNPTVLTDLNINYQFNSWLGLSFAVNNIFNITSSYQLKNLPAGTNEANLRSLIDFNGRYPQTSFGDSFIDINGSTFLTTLSFRF